MKKFRKNLPIKVNMKWNTKIYDEKHSFVYKYGEDLIKLLDPKKNESILDLGCGLGQLTFQISKLSKKVIGIDKSSEMIKQANLNYQNIEFKVADACNFQFEEKFDAIFSNAVLHWITDYESAIKCIYNHLNIGGRIVFEFGGKGNVELIINQLRNSLLLRGYEKQSKMNVLYFPSIGEYATELEKVGFRVTFAQHFDRLTELSDANEGIKDWISMFKQDFFERVSPKDTETIKTEVQEKLKDKLFINGKWFADYKRIRIVAIKEKEQ